MFPALEKHSNCTHHMPRCYMIISTGLVPITQVIPSGAEIFVSSQQAGRTAILIRQARIADVRIVFEDTL